MSDNEQTAENESAAEAVEAQDTTATVDGGGQDYARADFENLHADAADDGENLGAKSLDMILDIPVNVAVEIGRTRMSISNLLKLNQGSVVELDRFAGEPMDITVNGTLVAHGEVVVVNEKFGIRLTDIVSAAERVKKLK